jgi:hypothetical protein
MLFAFVVFLSRTIWGFEKKYFAFSFSGECIGNWFCEENIKFPLPLKQRAATFCFYMVNIYL